MHCNLGPRDVAPVILGFNYEVHNAPVYKFNNFATAADPYCTDTKFQRSRTVCGGVIAIDHLKFGRPQSQI